MTKNNWGYASHEPEKKHTLKPHCYIFVSKLYADFISNCKKR